MWSNVTSIVAARVTPQGLNMFIDNGAFAPARPASLSLGPKRPRPPHQPCLPCSHRTRTLHPHADSMRGDPCPGQGKVIIVKYQCGAGVLEQQAGENRNLVIHVPQGTPVAAMGGGFPMGQQCFMQQPGMAMGMMQPGMPFFPGQQGFAQGGMPGMGMPSMGMGMQGGMMMPQQQQLLRVLEAVYGADGHWTNVTAAVASRVTASGLHMYVSNDVFGDPCEFRRCPLRLGAHPLAARLAEPSHPTPLLTPPFSPRATMLYFLPSHTGPGVGKKLVLRYLSSNGMQLTQECGENRSLNVH
jgi:hypothetical protein